MCVKGGRGRLGFSAVGGLRNSGPEPHHPWTLQIRSPPNCSSDCTCHQYKRPHPTQNAACAPGRCSPRRPPPPHSALQHSKILRRGLPTPVQPHVAHLYPAYQRPGRPHLFPPSSQAPLSPSPPVFAPVSSTPKAAPTSSPLSSTEPGLSVHRRRNSSGEMKPSSLVSYCGAWQCNRGWCWGGAGHVGKGNQMFVCWRDGREIAAGLCQPTADALLASPTPPLPASPVSLPCQPAHPCKHRGDLSCGSVIQAIAAQSKGTSTRCESRRAGQARGTSAG